MGYQGAVRIPEFTCARARRRYAEFEDGTLTFVEDTAPTPAELRAIEDRVEARFGQWLKRNGFLDEESPEEQELDGWWTTAASDPSRSRPPPPASAWLLRAAGPGLAAPEREGAPLRSSR